MSRFNLGCPEPAPNRRFNLAQEAVSRLYPWRHNGNERAALWIAHLAQSHGLPVWGEKSGQDDVAKLQLSVQRMEDKGFLGLKWGFESELCAAPAPEGYATIDDCEAVIAAYSDQRTIWVPLVMKGR